MHERVERSLRSAAYGGAGWSPRAARHREEIGGVWAPCGIDSEWARLEAVLLSPPGPALAVAEPDRAQFLDAVDLAGAAAEHAALAALYRAERVEVVELPPSATHPNQMFCADLFAMTAEGAILARPASTVRAGEERAVAAALSSAGIPILATLGGGAVFEGADLLWAAPERAILGIGLRTNAEAARRIAGILGELDVALEVVDLPWATMHLMGMLRILSPGIAVAWPRRTPHRAVAVLREHGYAVEAVPTELAEADITTGLNAVTLAPGRPVMPAGQTAMARFFRELGADLRETPMAELSRAAGAVGCLTGVLRRTPAAG